MPWHRSTSAFDWFARQLRFLAGLSGLLALFALWVDAQLAPAQIQVFEGTIVITNGQMTPVNFGSVQQNQPGPTIIFTVTNAGGRALDLNSITGPSGYTINTNYPPYILGGSNGTFSVQLNSSTIGTNSGNISILNTDPNNTTFSFAVTGIVTPLPPAIQVFYRTNTITNGQMTPQVDFGSVQQNQIAPPITFTVTNSGGQTLDLESITVPSGYALDTNYPLTIAAGSNGTFSVQLNATVVGTNSGNISITNNAPNNPFVFAITGLVTGKVISLSGDLAFGVVAIGSNMQGTLTISNGGNTTLNVSNIIYPAGFSGNWSGGPITNGESQSVTVTLSPTVATNYGGNVTVISDATSGADTIPISGFGANDSLLLTVITNGAGTVSPNRNDKVLIAGRRYTLTATAKSGNVFSNWTGSITTNENPLTFTMETNTVVQANFITNPFLAVKGTYNGLFSTSNGVTEQTAGMLKRLTIGQKGTYSGTLLINGGSQSFSGSFDLAGQATKTITRASGHGGPLLLEMTLSSSSNSAPQVTGAVSGTNDEVPWTATNLMANLATNTLPSAEYTMLMLPDTNSAPTISPGGDGYALITNHAGKATITGALADGAAFSQSVPVSQDGSVPIYANLYGNKGLLLGWINLNPSNVSGTGLIWVHPPIHSGLFTDAFNSTNSIMLSPWTNPPAEGVLANLTNLSILDIINNTNGVTGIPVNISTTGKVNGSEVSGTINLKTGLLKLTVGSGANKTNGCGAILLNETNGAGYFLTKTNAGAVILGP